MPFDLTARIHLDGRSVATGLQKVKGHVANAMGSIKGQIAAAFGTAAVTAHLTKIVATVGRIKDLAEQYNATTDEVQKLDFALQQNGASFEDLGNALRRVGDAREKAAQGNTDLQATFEKYGVTLSDLKNPQLRHIDILQQIARTMGNVMLSQREANEVSELLGDKSAKLFTALASLGSLEGLKIFQQSDIDRIDDAAKKLAELNRQLMIYSAESLTALPDLRLRDFITPMLTPGTLDTLGIDSTATPGGDVAPLTQEEIQKGLEAMRKRLAAQANAATAALYGSDNNKQSDIDRLDKIEQRERQTRLSSMSPQDRAEALRKERGEIEASMTSRGFGTLADRERIAHIDAELLAAEQAETRAGPAGERDSFVRDDLARIGGFTGGVGNSEVKLQERMADGIDKLVSQGEQANKPFEF